MTQYFRQLVELTESSGGDGVSQVHNFCIYFHVTVIFIFKMDVTMIQWWHQGSATDMHQLDRDIPYVILIQVLMTVTMMTTGFSDRHAPACSCGWGSQREWGARRLWACWRQRSVLHGVFGQIHTKGVFFALWTQDSLLQANRSLNPTLVTKSSKRNQQTGNACQKDLQFSLSKPNLNMILVHHIKTN